MVAIPKGCFTLGADFAKDHKAKPSTLSPVAERAQKP
jgi:hypothetical protein